MSGKKLRLGLNLLNFHPTRPERLCLQRPSKFSSHKLKKSLHHLKLCVLLQVFPQFLNHLRLNNRRSPVCSTTNSRATERLHRRPTTHSRSKLLRRSNRPNTKKDTRASLRRNHSNPCLRHQVIIRLYTHPINSATRIRTTMGCTGSRARNRVQLSREPEVHSVRQDLKFNRNTRRVNHKHDMVKSRRRTADRIPQTQVFRVINHNTRSICRRGSRVIRTIRTITKPTIRHT